MKNHIRTEKEINTLQHKPVLVQRLLERMRRKGIQFPCPPGCEWLVLKHFFLKKQVDT